MCFYMVGPQGFEPWPYRLKVRCLNRLTIAPLSYHSCHCPYGLSLENFGTPNGIRTRVTALKGQCPRPLDDGCISKTNKELTITWCRSHCRIKPLLNSFQRQAAHTCFLPLSFKRTFTQQTAFYRNTTSLSSILLCCCFTTHCYFDNWSGWVDSNHRPLPSKGSRLTRLTIHPDNKKPRNLLDFGVCTLYWIPTNYAQTPVWFAHEPLSLNVR